MTHMIQVKRHKVHSICEKLEEAMYLLGEISHCVSGLDEEHYNERGYNERSRYNMRENDEYEERDGYNERGRMNRRMR